MECHSTRLGCPVRARPREELEAREKLSHFHSLFSDQAGSSSDMEAMDTTPPSQAGIVHSAPVFPSPPFTAWAAIGHSAGGTSDPEAMDTTPPSRAVIVQSAPSPSRTTTHFTPLFQVLGTHHPVVAMPQPVPRLSYLQRRPKDRPTFQSYDIKLRESWYQDRRMKNLESPWLIQPREKEKHRRERK
ncbi:uncharacterized protein AAG666_008836 isoform 4-T10 [Megaptera novaeangliae]